MAQKKICFFNSSKTWGGGEKWHFDMALRMNCGHYETLAVAGKRSRLWSKLKTTGIPVKTVAVSNLSFINPFKMYKVYTILKRERIHTIIMNLSEDVKIAGPAAKLAGVKNVVYRRGSAIPIKNTVFNRLLFKYCLTGVIANSRQTKDTILKNNPGLFPDDRIRVIYNGISLDGDAAPDMKPYYQRQPGEVVLGNAGRFVEQKGQQYLIEIAGRLKERNVRFRLLLAGEGKYADELRQLAIKQGVADEVLFLGFVTDINRFMHNIDIFLLTSLWEGFGYVLVEAMAAKKPVVAFDVSSNPEIVEDGRTGFLAKEMDIREFADKVEFLAHDERLRKKMGAAGRKRVEDLFAIERSARELGKYIDSPGQEQCVCR